MKYKYIAVDINNNKIKGCISADNSIDLLKQLKREKLYCLNYYVRKENRENSILNKISYKDIAIFCKYMNVSLKSGMGFVKSLEIVIYRVTNRHIKKSLKSVKHRIEGGESFSQALKQFPYIYPKLLINMIRLGEETGNLQKVFLNMEKYYKDKSRLKKKFITSLIYPTTVLFMGIAIQLFFMTTILPTFINQFNLNKQSLPMITQIYLLLSNGITNNKLKILLIIAIVSFLIYIAKDKSKFSNRFSKYILKVPFIGKCFMKKSKECFVSNMDLLMKSGLNVVESLKYSIDNIGNIYIKEKMNSALFRIFQGNSFSKSLKETELFEEFFIETIAVGEESGKLIDSFSMLKNILEEEIESILDKLLAITQPLTIIIIGILIGTLIIAMLLPMLNMIEVINT